MTIQNEPETISNKLKNIEVNEDIKKSSELIDSFDEELNEDDEEEMELLTDEKSRIKDWYKRQIELYELSQRRLVRNLEILPQTLTEEEILSINDAKARSYVNMYYKKSDVADNYKLNVENDDNLYTGGDDYLISYLVFKQGKVVWVDFGENVGFEFSGIHPALIIARPENRMLTVLPVVKMNASERNPAVVIIDIKNDSEKRGVALINEIKNISIDRIDRSKASMNISVSDFNRTLDRIKEFYSDMFSNSKTPYYI